MHAASYSSSKFWKKISAIPKQTECATIKKALTLYVILPESDTPVWVKTAIVSVLGYLIIPFDAYFDFLPGGYADDLAMMAALLVQLAVYTTPEVGQRVEDYLPERCR
jgi:uncharacterized membrane protein YkvA (DUF1232 family)